MREFNRSFRSSSSQATSLRGFTLPEAVVLAGLVPSLLSVGVVMKSGLDESAGITVSHSNLLVLSAAHATRAAEHDGRVFSASPDDYGAYSGCADYIMNRGCLDPIMLGWGESSPGECDCTIRWGYWIAHAGYCNPGNCANAAAIVPFDFEWSFGAFRLPNCERFNQYVNGRFYDETFYAPLDTLTRSIADPFIEGCCPFGYSDGSIAFSSYAFSPSAMWDPEVLRANASGGFRAPGSYDESHRAPVVTAADHPELKSLLFEHNWNHGKPGVFNPAAGENVPYQFNHGRDASPLTCFLDGSVRMVRTGKAESDDDRVRDQTGIDGLWHRETPLGSEGYHGLRSHDGVLVSHNILTTDGIEGRDVLDTILRDPDADGDGRVDGADLLGLLGDWGVDARWDSPHDIDADGAVSGSDLNVLLGFWSD